MGTEGEYWCGGVFGECLWDVCGDGVGGWGGECYEWCADFSGQVILLFEEDFVCEMMICAMCVWREEWHENGG